jgi:hypothetical protein
MTLAEKAKSVPSVATEVVTTYFTETLEIVPEGLSGSNSTLTSSRHVGHVNRKTFKSPRRALYGQLKGNHS